MAVGGAPISRCLPTRSVLTATVRMRPPQSISSSGSPSRPDGGDLHHSLLAGDSFADQAEDELDDMTLPMDARFMERIDRLAAARGLQSTDDYLAQWRWSKRSSVRARRRKSRMPSGSNSSAPPTGKISQFHARHADRQWTPDRGSGGVSLFTAAEQAGVRVPTSCITQGKCKECIVEIARGMELLSPPTDCEKHLDVRGSRFRLSCQCRVVRGRR